MTSFSFLSSFDPLYQPPGRGQSRRKLSEEDIERMIMMTANSDDTHDGDDDYDCDFDDDSDDGSEAEDTNFSLASTASRVRERISKIMRRKKGNKNRSTSPRGNNEKSRSHDFSKMLGNRKRRLNVVRENQIRVGAIVGESNVAANNSNTQLLKSNPKKLRKALNSAEEAEKLMEKMVGANDWNGICKVQQQKPKSFLTDDLKKAFRGLRFLAELVRITKKEKIKLERSKGRLV